VSVEDSVDMPRAAAGRLLRDSFLPGISALTLGLVRAGTGSLRLGPFDLLRFGPARVSRTAVEWPIEGGLLAGAPGGTWRLRWSAGRLTASVGGYRPRLPAAVYLVTQLPLHHLLSRLHLLRLRGRDPAPGITATSSDRMRAAAVDLALCATLAGLAGRRPRPRAAGDRARISRDLLEPVGTDPRWVGHEAAGGGGGRIAPQSDASPPAFHRPAGLVGSWPA